MTEQENNMELELEQKSALDVKSVKRAKKLRQRILFAVIILGVLGAVAGILIVTLCKVSTVVIGESTVYSQEELRAFIGIKEGDNLFSFPAGEIEKKLEANYPYLKDVKLVRQLPSTVYVTFTQDLGSMCIRLGEDYYAIDENQRVLKRCDSPDDGGQHRITIMSDRISRCVEGEQIRYSDESLFSMVDAICRAVEENGVLEKIDTIDMRDKFDIVMDFDSRFQIMLGNAENLKYKIAMVVKVVEELYEEDRGEIDVRETSTAYVKLYNQ